MNTWQMLRAADWLWPFLLLGMALVGLFAASLVRASGPAQTAMRPPASAGGLGRLPPWLITLLAPLLVVALYAALGNPRAINPRERQPVPDQAAETMVGQLAERLKTQPEDLQGWRMLARSYKVLSRYAESADAWEHAKDLVWNDVESLSEWVEARILSQGQRFDRRSQELLARAMSLDPEYPGVLLLRGLAALDRGDTAAAQKALAALRDQYPDASPDRNALDTALAQIAAGQDPRMTRRGPADADARSANAGAASAGASAASAPASAALATPATPALAAPASASASASAGALP